MKSHISVANSRDWLDESLETTPVDMTSLNRQARKSLSFSFATHRATWSIRLRLRRLTTIMATIVATIIPLACLLACSGYGTANGAGPGAGALRFGLGLRRGPPSVEHEQGLAHQQQISTGSLGTILRARGGSSIPTNMPPQATQQQQQQQQQQGGDQVAHAFVNFYYQTFGTCAKHPMTQTRAKLNLATSNIDSPNQSTPVYTNRHQRANIASLYTESSVLSSKGRQLTLVYQTPIANLASLYSPLNTNRANLASLYTESSILSFEGDKFQGAQ
eukprot:1330997-Amorphochlora_amoeboformis.AAC.4